MRINFYEIFVNLLIINKKPARKLKQLPIDEIENIVVYSNTAIGDTLFNTPVLKALKEKYPLKKVIIILNPINYILFKNNPYVDEIILYDGKWKSFFSTLSQLKKISRIDLTLILHSNEPQATPLALLSNSKYILKIPNKSKYSIYHNNDEIGPYHDRHGIFDRIRVLEYLNIKNVNPRMELYLEKENKNEIKKFFFENNINKDKDLLIGFQIGASTISRMWFEERWVELGKKLLNSNKNIKIIITGSPAENKLTTKIFNSLNDARVFNLAGKFNLKSAAVLIGSLDVFITPDTGPLHIAASLKVPTVTLFAAAKWYVSNPCFDQDIHLYVQKDRTCEPCVGKNCKFQECMLQISADEVFDKVYTLSKLK